MRDLRDLLDFGQFGSSVARLLHVCICRTAAIALAIAEAKVGDTVLIAGKGHETYQEIGGVRLPFNDAERAAQRLQQRQAA